MNDTEKNQRLRTISTEELAAKLSAKEKFEFWNVLTEEYYSRENIAGSRHVPLDRVGREAAEGNLPKGTEIVVYCTGPECPQSTAAAEKLRAYGFTNVAVYKGGLEEWEAAGLMIEPDISEPAAEAAAQNAGMSRH
jgi:rhodanese-related sulfurtransferase